MDSESNGTGNKPVSAADFHGELLEIYAWPFALVIVFCALGVVGNSIVLYIYISKWKNTKTRGFIIALASLNLVNSLFNMPVEAYILYNPLTFDVHWLCKVTRGLTFIINNVCGSLVVAIAIDRMLLVYKPLKRNVLTMRYVRWSCLISFLVGVATSWPGCLFYGTATVTENINGINITGKTCFLSENFMRNPKWPKIFNVILFSLMVTVFIILIILYSLVLKKLCQIRNGNSFGKTSRFSLKSVLKSITFQRITSLRTISTISSTNEESSSDSCVTDVTNDTDVTYDVTVAIAMKKSRSDSMMPKRCERLGRQVSGFNKRASHSHTIAMLLITVGFILSFLPYLVIVSVRYVDPMFYSNLGRSGLILYHVFLRSYFLNSVISPVVYSFVSREFRTILKRMVCSR